MMSNLPCCVLFLFLLATSYSNVSAATYFPYSTRTKLYSGYSTGLRGDINSIGMGGATIALPYSVSAAQLNPAGFAMETASVSAQIVKNSIHDGHLQRGDIEYESNQWGLAVNPSPWGLGLIYYSPTSESGNYVSPNTNQELSSEISVKQFRAIVARGFFENQLSIGMGIGFAKAIRQLGPYSYGATSFDFQFGALYRLPDRLIIGLSYIPQNTIRPSGDVYPQNDMPGFNQAIVSPHLIGGGLGWVPNRFFKVGLSLLYAAPTSGTALLADENKTIGKYATLQTRLGGSYVLAEFNNFKVEYALGTYYEPSRIEDEPSRLHGTMGLELNPWFLNTGIGFDLAKDYKNLMISVGIDIVRTARTLGIIPKDPVPPYKGFFPPPTKTLADGLPGGMTQGDDTGTAPPSLGDVQKIVEDIPKRIKEKLNPNTKKKKTTSRPRRKR